MIRPILGAWITQRDEGTCIRIDGADIASLATIVYCTGQREVLEGRLAPVFFGHHMINLMGRGRDVLVKRTVLAVIACPLDNLAS